MTSGSLEMPQLPEEPQLSLVIETLGLSGHDAVTQIDTVLQYRAQSNLKLYLPRGLGFVAQYGVEVEPVDRHGNGAYELMSCGKAHHFNTNESDIQVGHAVLVGSGAVLVDEVVFQEDRFCPVSECQLFLEPLAIDPARLFVKRGELEDFLRHGPTALPSYLNPSSDLYAPELALAVEVHQALFEGGARDSGLNLEDRVHRWLCRHGWDTSSPSSALVKRLAAIINPRKKKGNPFYRSKT